MLTHRIVLASALALSLATPARAADDVLSADERQALRVFQMNRLFAMLGYLQQQTSGQAFDWSAVGFGEVANAGAGLGEKAKSYGPAVRKLVEEHESRHRKNALGSVGVAAAGIVRGTATLELDHAAIDVTEIQKRLRAQPGASQEEQDALARLEADLQGKFKGQIPGLAPHQGGFLKGGRYLASAFSNPSDIPFFTKRFGARRLFLPTEDRKQKLKDAFEAGYLRWRTIKPGEDIAAAVRESYKTYAGDDECKSMFRQGWNRARASDKAIDLRTVDYLGEMY